LQDTGLIQKPVFISVLNLRPVTLNKEKILISFHAEFPKFYKYLNLKSGKIERVSESSVLNEAYYMGHVVYGFERKHRTGKYKIENNKLNIQEIQS
jgi:hypothetical protein